METPKTTPHRISVEDTLALLASSENGLSSKDALDRQQTFGKNVIPTSKKTPLLVKYLAQFKDLMILLLLSSALLALFMGDAKTAVVLFVLILFNTLIGFFQEYSAERTMEALQHLVAEKAQALRDGKITEIDTTELVPGDIIVIDEGQSVPADVRLIKVTAFATNDFALTGESQPTKKFTHALAKDVAPALRHNQAFMGTTVAMGEAIGVVIATGKDTELGRIAELSDQTTEDLSPLQREINHIATILTYAVTFLCTILLAVAIYKNLPIKDAVLFAIGFASSLIPQGLPAEINTSLAQAARKLAKAKALVKRLSAVETLGATHVICTDKTGTLTKNQMTVEGFIVGFEEFEVQGIGYAPEGKLIPKDGVDHERIERSILEEFIVCGEFASNARIVEPDETHPEWYCIGDPTEGALVALANKAGVDVKSYKQNHLELREIPFDSARKRMTSIREFSNDEAICYVKGAPESVLERSTMILDGNIVRPITEEDKAWYLKEYTKRAGQALRNLAYAKRTISHHEIHGTMDEVESGLTFLGIVSMRDPLREAVPGAMTAALKAHIAVNIITGDFALTAEAIARKAQLLDDDKTPVVIVGEELSKHDDKELLQLITKGGVIFSRVSPEDKLRIVGLVRESGLVVAVTGDGINDAPALKRADIGVAMGITGTDVAKQSADIVLLDDSFATLVKAIQQGRIIFANIKKATLSCFTSNLMELFVNIFSLVGLSIFAIPLGLNVMQLLSIDLFAELLPIAALGWDKGEGELMKAKPRNPKDHILNLRNIIDLVWCGIIVGTLAYANYLLYFSRHGVSLDSIDTSSTIYFAATTMTYLTMVLSQLFNIIQRRSAKGLFSKYQLHNKVFWIAILASISGVLALVYSPFLSHFFGNAALNFEDWLYILGATGIFLVIREIQLRLIPRQA